MVEEIEGTKQFKKEVLESELPVVLEIAGQICPACLEVERLALEPLEGAYKGQVRFLKLYTFLENKEVLDKLKVGESVPELYLFKGEKVVHRHIGKLSKEDVEKLINKHFKEHLK